MSKHSHKNRVSRYFLPVTCPVEFLIHTLAFASVRSVDGKEYLKQFHAQKPKAAPGYTSPKTDVDSDAKPVSYDCTKPVMDYDI